MKILVNTLVAVFSVSFGNNSFVSVEAVCQTNTLSLDVFVFMLLSP